VDLGAFEHPAAASRLSYEWLQRFGLPTDGTADLTDSDGDGVANAHEWAAGTDPTNAASAFVLRLPSLTATGISFKWSSVTNRTYFVERSTATLSNSAFEMIRSNIAGEVGTTTIEEPRGSGETNVFYRVGIH
jgi:hypothetical protein